MGAVKIWEEEVIIPTYEVGAADKNPMFLEKRVYQGSSGKIYPYPATNEISREKKDKAWKAVWLENDYIRVMILPELGGRIQRAYDKTNDYDFVYYNRVIKPALVGLTGPWISGGIEFNWPQHHRPTTYCPVDYKIIENEDGSKSLLTGDTDLMYGTEELTKFTLYPDRAYIEITGQLYNGTPFPQTFLWWANPAVSVNDHTQSVFPSDVHNVYDHGKRDVSEFPIARGEYYKHDYSAGVDISRYKNIPVPTSYMAESSEYDFVGGYDHEKKAGLLHVADHHVSPGKKQWTWGCGDFGRAWDRNLTDEDGPYIELMTGMYCDNQPDFSWLKPFEEKTFKQYFMPYKAVGMVKNATIHAAINAGLNEDGLYVCVYATQVYDEAMVLVYDKDGRVYEEKTRLSPLDIYEKTIPVNIKDKYGFKVAVEYKGKVLVSYEPKDEGTPAIAKPAVAPAAPEDMKTNEELFLTGQHLEQYRHATWLPDPYYLEGLKRDKGDVRINNAYGLLLMRRNAFAEAEPYFRNAIKRLTGDGMFNNPYDSEPFYNLGLDLFYMERFDEAYDAFYKATWSNEQQEMAFYYLAAIANRRGDPEQALDLAEKGLVKNAHNIKARGLKGLLLAKLGFKDEARKWLGDNLLLNAFDYFSMYELRFLEGSGEEELDKIRSLNRDFKETYLKTARCYAEFGEYDKAVRVLDTYKGDYPLIHYYRGYYLTKLGRAEEGLRCFKEADKSDPSYCFPNKAEDAAVLTAAAEYDPKGAKAYYYLGCLNYDKLQFDKAIELWEKSERLDRDYATLERNLAIAYYNKRGDVKRALECMEHAFRLDPGDARVFLELDQLYQKLSVSPADRLLKFRDNAGLTEKRDDLYTEFITVLNLNHEYKEAYERISSHSFQTWEGAEGKITAQFKVSLLSLAWEDMKKGDHDSACEKLLTALSYPENLGEGRLEGTKDNNLYYNLGLVYEAMGRGKEAEDCFTKATLGKPEPAGVMYYYDQPADMILYMGMAHKKLGNTEEAERLFKGLIDYADEHMEDIFMMDYFAVSLPDMSVFDADMTLKNRLHCLYLKGLGNLGLLRKDDALKAFKEVLKADPNHQNAAIYLGMAKSL